MANQYPPTAEEQEMLGTIPLPPSAHLMAEQRAVLKTLPLSALLRVAIERADEVMPAVPYDDALRSEVFELALALRFAYASWSNNDQSANRLVSHLHRRRALAALRE